MKKILFPRFSKHLALTLSAAILSVSSGCSLPSLGPFTPLLKMGYNAFATAFNAMFFGGTTVTNF